ncbi:hypothetical protein OGAPHI_005046 [Ogataea philodendri]|uniref:BRCT domain-containing protein n=1 Tax=Ogataea philodendri TaxID=1378263 RepID=A0A9P8P1N6_9ASCO|nr:uncharacterized protein OGAPHI_005046 [Ogataea philodendri]KAH3663645.1 hypothetical protein OGAPHI_005046 [Ogataea philodendri]
MNESVGPGSRGSQSSDHQQSTANVLSQSSTRNDDSAQKSLPVTRKMSFSQNANSKGKSDIGGPNQSQLSHTIRTISGTQLTQNFRINDSPVSMLKAVHDPFEDSPDSTSTPAHSKLITRPLLGTPSQSAASRSKQLAKHNASADAFKKMRDQIPEAFEYDTEMGIVLNDHDDNDETHEESGTFLNLRGGFANFKGKFDEGFTVDTSPATQMDENINEEINEKLRQKETNDQNETDYSYLNNYINKRLSQQDPSSKQSGLQSSAENGDTREIQVPGTIEKSRMGIISNSSPLRKKSIKEIVELEEEDEQNEQNDEIISSQSLFSQMRNFTEYHRTQKDTHTASSPNFNEPSSQEVSDFEFDENENENENGNQEELPVTLNVSNSQHSQTDPSAGSQKELRSVVERFSQNSHSSQSKEDQDMLTQTVPLLSQTQNVNDDVEDINDDLRGDANAISLSQVAYTSSLLLRPKRTLNTSPRKLSPRKVPRSAPPVISLDDSSRESSRHNSESELDQHDVFSMSQSNEREIKDSMDETRINSILDRKQINVLLSTRKVEEELTSPAFEHTDEIQSQIRKQSQSTFEKKDILPIETSSQEIYRDDETTKEFREEDIIFPRSVWVTLDNKKFPFGIRSVSKYQDEKNSMQYSISISNSEFVDVVDQGKIFAPLGIKIGDNIKILDNRMKTYKVTGLQFDISLSHMVKCIRGYNRVYIVDKADEHAKEISVPIEEIYLTAQQGSKLSFKIFDDETRFQKYLSSLEDQDITEIQHTLPTIQQLPFHGCLFVLTSAPQSEGSDPTKLRDIIKFIECHGGTVVDEGLPKIVKVGNQGLESGPGLHDLKFAALLSPKHVRTMKYFQSLALGWPIISTSFIEDMIEDPERINVWEKSFPSYLLPSGHSSKRNCVLNSNVYAFMANFYQGVHLDQQLGLKTILKDVSIAVDRETLSVSSRDLDFLLKALGCTKVRVLKQISHSELSKLDQDTILFTGLDKKSLKSQLHRRSSKKRKVDLPEYENELLVVDWEWLVQCIIADDRFEPLFRWKVNLTRK